MGSLSPIPRRILFIKTLGKSLSLMGPSNQLLLETLRNKGLQVDERCWYPQHPETEALTLQDLTSYYAVTFIACWDYNLHITEFENFIRELVIPAQAAGVEVVNSPGLILWNSNKVYLRDLERELGVAIPETIFVDTEDGDIPLYQDVISKRGGAATTSSVVIKPSVSASAKETHRIPDPSSASYDPIEAQTSWAQVYDYARSLSPSVKVMIQAFEPAIKNGEYSIIFLGGEYSHTILKKPAETDFRAIEEHGAQISALEDSKVPEQGKRIGRKIIDYVGQRFDFKEGYKLGYLRLDGVVREPDGKFVVIEAEMLEPYVYFDSEGARQGLHRFCDMLAGGVISN